MPDQLNFASVAIISAAAIVIFLAFGALVTGCDTRQKEYCREIAKQGAQVMALTECVSRYR